MKKILLTTPALSMLAGVANAGLSVGGDARVGITSKGGATTVGRRFRAKFNGSGETDNGITFGAGAGIRWDGTESTASATPAAGLPATPNIWASNVWVSNGTATLRVGNVGGAIASTAGIWSVSVGFSGMSSSATPFLTHTSASSGGAGSNLAALSMSLGSANIAVSTGIAGASDTEVAANFATGAMTIGVGYDTGSVSGTTGTYVSVATSLGGADVHVNYATASTGVTFYSIGGSMAAGAGTISAYIGNNSTAGVGAISGIGYAQSLGGGATAKIGLQNVASAATPLTIQAGLTFGF